MNNAKSFTTIFVLASLLGACSPQAVVSITPTQPVPTETSFSSTATLTFTPLPTETLLPIDTASPTPPSCAVPVNPIADATIPAKGPFDFTWLAFDGASSYVVSIGPIDWYPTNFPVTGTTLTRYMENFPNSPSYEWSITALDSSGREICKAGPYKFTTSVNQSATPSFAGSSISAPAGTSQVDSEESIAIPEKFSMSLVSLENEACGLSATFSVSTTYPVNTSILRFTTDPNEGNSSDFCNWGNAVNLWPVSPGIYQGSLDLSAYQYLHDGDTIYLMAKFIYSQGSVGCSQLIQHTLSKASCPENEVVP